MKNFAVALLLLVSGFASANTGVGLMIGNPTGITGKHWLNENQAIDAGVGFLSTFSLHGDYLFHNKGAFFLNDVNALDFYFGAGARMKFEDDIVLGLRAPVGLAHQFSEVNADAFLEVAPILDFVSHYGFAFHLILGSRYYF